MAISLPASGRAARAREHDRGRYFVGQRGYAGTRTQRCALILVPPIRILSRRGVGSAGTHLLASMAKVLREHLNG